MPAADGRMPAADGRMRAADVRPADVEAFRTSGVLVMPNFFTAEEAAAMRRSVADLRDRGLMSNLMVDAPAGEPAAENLQMAWLSKHSMLWQCLPWEPRVVAAAERLLGASRSGVGGCEVHYDQSFLKPPSVGAGTSWHTDNGYFRIQDPLKGVGMWIAVDDASIENGTLHVVPGVEGRFPEPAHGRDTRSSLLSCADDIDEEEAVPCELEAGGWSSSATGCHTARTQTAPPPSAARWRTTSSRATRSSSIQTTRWKTPAVAHGAS